VSDAPFENCVAVVSVWEGAVQPGEPRPFDAHAFLALLGEGHSIASYRQGHAFFTQGDPADSVFYLQCGKVKLTTLSTRGKEAVIGILSDGHFFGEGCLAGQPARMAAAVALTECAVAQVEMSVMRRILHDDSEFSGRFIVHLLTRNIRIEEDLIDHLFNSSEKRLARALLLLANVGKDVQPQDVIPHLSQETLAEMVGTTRSRVSYFLNKFRKLGFIEYNGGMHVNPSLLNVILQDERAARADT
jgi:CRP-like cAMP-binding protein